MSTQYSFLLHCKVDNCLGNKFRIYMVDSINDKGKKKSLLVCQDCGHGQMLIGGNLNRMQEQWSNTTLKELRRNE